MAAAAGERRHVGLWVLVGLIVLGLIPFFISALVARSARRRALADPAARRLLTDGDPPPLGR